MLYIKLIIGTLILIVFADIVVENSDAKVTLSFFGLQSPELHVFIIIPISVLIGILITFLVIMKQWYGSYKKSSKQKKEIKQQNKEIKKIQKQLAYSTKQITYDKN